MHNKNIFLKFFNLCDTFKKTLFNYNRATIIKYLKSNGEN